MELRVFCTTQFVARHRWKDAPEQVHYLRDFHRHLFKIRLEKAVEHTERDVEFLQLKEEVDAFCRDRYEMQELEFSCEAIALQLAEQFGASKVEVSEDGECGAVVEGTPYQFIKRTDCYTTVQAEGPDFGHNFLFVPGGISPSILKKVLRSTETSVHGVHYGAGNDRDLRLDTTLMLLRCWTGPLIIEVDRDTKTEVIETLAEYKTDKYEPDRVKIVSVDFPLPVADWAKFRNHNHSYWMELGRNRRVIPQANDHPLYTEDDEVEV